MRNLRMVNSQPPFMKKINKLIDRLKKFTERFRKIILSEFKWYRKRKGGIWFLIEEKDPTSGFANAQHYWSQERPEKDSDFGVIEIHNYD